MKHSKATIKATRNNLLSSTIKKLSILGAIFFLTACSYYPTGEGLTHAQPIGDFQKCMNKKNHDLPTCFCHSEAVIKNPERANYCDVISAQKPILDVDLSLRTATVLELENTLLRVMDSGENWLSNKISANARSEEWLKEFRAATFLLEQPITEKVEFWSDNTELYLSGHAVIDDCDTSDSLLDLAFALGGFKITELTKILVDTNPYDGVAADHYVSAVWINGNWMVIDQQDEQLKPLMHIELGGYTTRDGRLARSAEIVAYRKLNQANWHQGKPPKLIASI